jgi:hypothetical protein
MEAITKFHTLTNWSCWVITWGASYLLGNHTVCLSWCDVCGDTIDLLTFYSEKFVTVPWSAILNYSADFLAQMILLVILAGFVHALVGNPIYKVITFICALGALGLSISVFYSLTGIGILNNFNRFSYLTYFLIGESQSLRRSGCSLSIL